MHSKHEIDTLVEIVQLGQMVSWGQDEVEVPVMLTKHLSGKICLLTTL